MSKSKSKSKTQTGELEFRPDPKQTHPDIDPKVKLPGKVRHAAALADALSTGKPVPPTPQSSRTRSRRIEYTDAEIDQVLQDWDRGALKPTDPTFEIIIGLAQEGARQIKARRRGAQQPREKSDDVTRRQEALLESYREQSSKRQKTPTGENSVAALRQSVIQKLGLQDDDDVVSEDTIKKDIQQLRPLFRLIERGIIPPNGKPVRQQGISDKTRQEMEAGARAVARAAAAQKSRRRSGRGQEGKK